MSQSELAIAGFYDHEQETTRRAPDWGGDDLFEEPGPRRRRFERASRPAPAPAPSLEPMAPPVPASAAAPAPPVAAAPAADRYAEPVPMGRRTVTITGHPGGVAAARRPSRTLDERIGHRPERIASWTCALGALSILLSIVTST